MEVWRVSCTDGERRCVHDVTAEWALLSRPFDFLLWFILSFLTRSIRTHNYFTLSPTGKCWSGTVNLPFFVVLSTFVFISVGICAAAGQWICLPTISNPPDLMTAFLPAASLEFNLSIVLLNNHTSSAKKLKLMLYFRQE